MGNTKLIKTGNFRKHTQTTYSLEKTTDRRTQCGDDVHQRRIAEREMHYDFFLLILILDDHGFKCGRSNLYRLKSYKIHVIEIQDMRI